MKAHQGDREPRDPGVPQDDPAYEGESPRSLCLVPCKRDDVVVATGCFRSVRGSFRRGALIAVTEAH